jgi:hypothetical protein
MIGWVVELCPARTLATTRRAKRSPAAAATLCVWNDRDETMVKWQGTCQHTHARTGG